MLQNNNAVDPDCKGMEGVLEAYYNTLSTVKLHGPTHFAPAVKFVAE